MNIRPARLASILLGKDLTWSHLSLERCLRMLRLCGAPIETQIHQIAQSGGSALWLENFLEQLHECQVTRSIVDRVLHQLVHDTTALGTTSTRIEVLKRRVIEGRLSLDEEVELLATLG